MSRVRAALEARPPSYNGLAWTPRQVAQHRAANRDYAVEQLCDRINGRLAKGNGFATLRRIELVSCDPDAVFEQVVALFREAGWTVEYAGRHRETLVFSPRGLPCPLKLAGLR